MFVQVSFPQIQWEISFCLFLGSLTIREVCNRTHLTIILQFKDMSVCNFNEKHCWDAEIPLSRYSTLS